VNRVSSAPRARHPRRRLRAVTAVLCSAVALAACGGAAAEPTVPSPVPSPSASPAPAVPSPTQAAAPQLDPLTGAGPIAQTAVVAVKIDNSPLARPYFRGLGEASLVYQELMEGGATRFLAVYSPAIGAEVGPIRSVREGDIELLAQFGQIALGASGANAGVLATVAEAEKDGQILDANYERVPGPYRKGERRKDAINFYASPAAIDQARPGGTFPKDIGLRFGPLPADAGVPAGTASVRFSAITRMTLRYDAGSGRYAVLDNGEQLKGAAPANVVIQHVKIRDTPYRDVIGNATPYSVTVGEGAAVLLRDGRRISGTWSRPTRLTGTRLLDDTKRDLVLKPGPTWFLLVPAGSALDVG
jgi:hypothetical protein